MERSGIVGPRIGGREGTKARSIGEVHLSGSDGGFHAEQASYQKWKRQWPPLPTLESVLRIRDCVSVTQTLAAAQTRQSPARRSG
jgi:hypothetical protein